MKAFSAYLTGGLVLLCASLLAAQVTFPTYQHDSYRSGANTQETILTTANVNTSQFGRKAVFPVQGYVYAQPLYVPNVNIGGSNHNVLFVATEHDQVYAFDVNSQQLLWHTNFLGSSGPMVTISPISSNDVNCTDLVPEIGISGTPAIDTTTNTIYVVTETKQLNSQTHVTLFLNTLHALDITTGKDKVAPHQIIAVAHGTGTGSVGGLITFDALLANQRPALLIADGQVFVSWASHCDLGNYHGWLMSFKESTLASTGVFMDTPNGYEGGFWAGGSGAAADSAGAIYDGTGNGYFSANNGGVDYGDSVLRLTWSSSGLTAADYFTPWDQQVLDEDDTDLGSGGVLLLPDQAGSRYPHLLVQAGKEGTIDLINRDNMGHFHSGNDNQIVQTLPFVIGGIWGAPAFWNNTAYFGGAYDHLKAFTYNPQTQLLSTGPTTQSPEVFSFPGSTPAISSNGTSNGIVWIVETDNYGGGYAIVRAYNANNLATELYNSEQDPSRDRPGLAVKFVVPTVADGHVFVATENQVAMYGLLQ